MHSKNAQIAEEILGLTMVDGVVKFPVSDKPEYVDKLQDSGCNEIMRENGIDDKKIPAKKNRYFSRNKLNKSAKKISQKKSDEGKDPSKKREDANIG